MELIRRFKSFCKSSSVMERLTWPVFYLYRSGVLGVSRLLRGIDGNKVVFSSFISSAYNDNPRYISERLHELRPQTDIVWLCRKGAEDRMKTPDYVRKVCATSLRGLAEQATAKVWVDNVKKSETVTPCKKQCYINTWHGDRGFKRVGADNEKFKMRHARMEKHCSLMVAGSDFGANVDRTAFGYEGEIMKVGCPRNDLLINGDDRLAARVRRELGIPDGTRILIYAPTFRDADKGKKQHAGLDLRRTLKCLEETTGEKWVVLYRAHYIAANGLDLQSEQGRIIDASKWPEMAELLLISDMLISDYSSCTADFTLTRRPAFLYVEDIDDYTGNDRSFYFDLKTSPFPMAKNMDELETLIRTTDAATAKATAEALDAFFGANETGHATESVCEYIMDRLN